MAGAIQARLMRETYDPAATLYFARRTTQPTLSRKAVYSTLFRSLRQGAVSGSDILSKLDSLHIYATDNSTDALLNLLSSSIPATLVDAPTFTTDRGFDTDGTNDAVDTGLNPTTASHFTQNSACSGFWSRKSTVTGGSVYGWFDGTDGFTLSPRNTTDIYTIRANQASTSSSGAGTSTDGSGMFSLNRSASNAWQLYRNGSSVLTGSTASAAVNNATLKTGNASSGSFAITQTAADWAGSSLTANEQTDLYNALRAYMTAVGVP